MPEYFFVSECDGGLYDTRKEGVGYTPTTTGQLQKDTPYHQHYGRLEGHVARWRVCLAGWVSDVLCDQ